MKNKKSAWAAFIPFLLADVLITMLLMTSSTATPYITSDFGLTSQQAPWMNTLYTMSAAVLAPLMGWYGDKKGIKRQLIVGILVFMAANILCAWSPNYVLFCAGRFFAGFGLAAAYPAALSFITNQFPAQQKVGAFAILGACINVGSGTGPTIAGILLNIMDWRMIFLLSDAVMLVVLAYVMMAVNNEQVEPSGKKIDAWGMGYLFVGIGTLLTLLTLSSQLGWMNPVILLLLAVSAVTLVLFCKHESKVDTPLLNIALLKNKGFVVPALSEMLLYGIKGYCSVAIPYYFTMGLGLSSSLSGLWLTLFFMAGFPVSFFVGKANKIFTTRTLAVFSVATWLICMVVFCGSGNDASLPLMYTAAAIASIGVAIMVGISNSSALKGVPAEQSGAASGAISLLSNLGSSVISATIIPYLGVIGQLPDGTPNYLVSFPKVAQIMLFPIGISMVLAFMYPKDKNN